MGRRPLSHAYSAASRLKRVGGVHAKLEQVRRFLATLNPELEVDHRHWAGEADVRRDVFRWLAFCDHRRRHSRARLPQPR